MSRRQLPAFGVNMAFGVALVLGDAAVVQVDHA
jgi:hypothetical protein